MLLRCTPTWLRVTLFVFVGDMALAGFVQSQDGGRCLECAVNINVLGPGVPRAEMTDGTQASLSTTSAFWTIQKRVNEVTLFFSASDHRNFVQGLSQDDIRVTDDGKEITRISAFRAQNALPLRLGLVVDTSGSVNLRFRFEQHAAVQFLYQVVRPARDQAFVLGFAEDINVTADYSDDYDQLAAGVSALHNGGGGTAFFDAIQKACDKLMTGKDSEPSARILIVLSDGDDNASKTTLVQAIERAQMRDVTIYTINTSGQKKVGGNCSNRETWH